MKEKSVRSSSRYVTISVFKKGYLKTQLNVYMLGNVKLVSAVKFNYVMISRTDVNTVIRLIEVPLLLYAS
jgi:hypothetical protein